MRVCQTTLYGRVSSLAGSEILCQILKLATANPAPSRACKAWELLALCCAFHPPPADFQPFLAKHCFDVARPFTQSALAL